ncbi:MAG: PH domain-containing protein [Jatrophihabitantaceae bacterium]
MSLSRFDRLDPQWRRLSPRMLLIHPVREVGRALPALAGLLLAGSRGGFEWWPLLGLLIVMALSLLRWFTTRYRITAAQVQLRTGLFRRRTITTPIDRVRTVDITAHVLHRLLGLTRVAIGTGSSDRKREGLVLDGLGSTPAATLRADLLHRAGQPPLAPAAAGPPGWGASPAPGGAAPPAAYQPAEQLLARLDPSWLRFAPFTLSGVLSALAILGLGWRIVGQSGIQADQVSIVRSVSRHLEVTPVWLDAVQLGLGALVGVTLLSVGGYLLAFWNFRLTRHPGGSLHVSRGLITARATSIAERRLRGVELSQLLPLRAVGGARLLAVATGLRVGRGAERGGTLLLPAAPAERVRQVAAAVLNVAGLPVRPALRRHGPAARRRRYLRSVAPAMAVALALLGGWLAGGLPGWLPVLGVLLAALAVPLAEDRFTGLGHALVGPYLISRLGSFNRRQVLLRRDGIIGWNIRQSFFQRRAGLATLTATTAAGRQAYPIVDLDADAALRLAAAALPGLLDDFLTTSAGSDRSQPPAIRTRPE